MSTAIENDHSSCVVDVQWPISYQNRYVVRSIICEPMGHGVDVLASGLTGPRPAGEVPPSKLRTYTAGICHSARHRRSPVRDLR